MEQAKKNLLRPGLANMAKKTLRQVAPAHKPGTEKHFMYHAKQYLHHFASANHHEAMAHLHRENSNGDDHHLEKSEKSWSKMEAHEKASKPHEKEISKHYGADIVNDIRDTDYGHGNTNKKTMHADLKHLYGFIKK